MTGRELRRLRRRLGWTQERMARELGLSHRNSVYRFEGGERRIDKVLEIAVRWPRPAVGRAPCEVARERLAAVRIAHCLGDKVCRRNATQKW